MFMIFISRRNYKSELRR